MAAIQEVGKKTVKAEGQRPQKMAKRLEESHTPQRESWSGTAPQDSGNSTADRGGSKSHGLGSSAAAGGSCGRRGAGLSQKMAGLSVDTKVSSACSLVDKRW